MLTKYYSLFQFYPKISHWSIEQKSVEHVYLKVLYGFPDGDSLRNEKRGIVQLHSFNRVVYDWRVLFLFLAKIITQRDDSEQVSVTKIYFFDSCRITCTSYDFVLLEFNLSLSLYSILLHMI